MRISLRIMLIGCCLAACKTPSHRSELAAAISNDQDRQTFISTARVWDQPSQPVGQVDFSTMDPDCQALKANAPLTCTFAAPKRGGGSTGWTPKFKCILDNGKSVTVKYGNTNAEIYHEVFSSRLMQALGFHADCDYPIRNLVCQNCPADPFKYSIAYRQSKENPNEPMATRTFDAAMVEYFFAPGFQVPTVNGQKKEGWGFDEILGSLRTMDPQQQIAREALTLLMAVIQHTDNRLDNQSLYCRQALDGLECPPENRYLVVGDVGSTAGAFKLPKASSDGGIDVPPALSYFFWDSAPIWQNWVGAKSSNCTVQVIAFDTISPATLKSHKISEAGRKFLADLLAQLSDTQLEQLVAFAKLGERQAEANITTQVWDSITKMQAWAAPLRIIPFSPVNAQQVANKKWTATLRKKINKVLESQCAS